MKEIGYSAQAYRKHILLGDKIHGLRKRQKTADLNESLLRFFLFVLLITVVLGCLEAYAWLSPKARSFFVLAAAILIVIAGVYGPARKIRDLLFRRRLQDDVELSLKIGEAFPAVKDRLANAIQVYRAKDAQSSGTSKALAEASLLDAARDSDAFEFGKAVDFSGTVRPLRFLVLTVFAAVLLALLSDSWRSGLYRMFHPARAFTRPSIYEWTVLPGNARIVQGDPVELSACFTGPAPASVTLIMETESGRQNTMQLKDPYTHRIEAASKNFRYWMQAGREESPRYFIQVRQKPMISRLQMKIVPPVYTRLALQDMAPDMGDAEVLKGSMIELALVSTAPLHSARMDLEDGRTLSLQTDGVQASVRFRVEKEIHYTLTLMDTSGLSSDNPVRYAIRLRPDLFPVARILYPEGNTDLGEGMKVDLLLDGEDDFGLTSGRIGYWISRDMASGDGSDTSFMRIPIDPGWAGHFQKEWTWDLSAVELFPEDVVSYFFEVSDNDAVSGPKRGRSQILTVRFPSIQELFEEIEAEQDRQTASLEDMLEQGRRLQDEMNRLDEALKSGREISWENRKNFQDGLQKQASMEKELQSLGEHLNEITGKLSQQNLAVETLEKYKELQNLYEEISTPELREAMNRLQESLQQIPEDQLKNELQKLQLNQEMFIQSIERTLNLLKRLKVEQKIQELIKRSEDMVQKQDSLNRDLRDAGDRSREELSGDQERIKKEADSFQQEMESLHGQMEQLNGMPLMELESIMAKMDSIGMMDQLSRVQMDIQQGRMDSAARRGSRSAADMMSMKKSLEQMLERMGRKNRERIQESLRRASYRLLQVSAEQEELSRQITNGSISRSRAAERQASIETGLSQVADSIYQISRETFSISPQIGKALGMAKASMSRSQQTLSQSDQNVAGEQARSSGLVHQAVLAMQETSEGLDGQSGSGMEDFLAGLEQAGAQQAALSRALAELLGQGNLSPQAQAAMQRLAAQQRALKDRLEKLIRDHGDMPGIAGRLDDVAQEMERVLEDLDRRRPDRRTIDRQEKILSRLLDAQKSLNQRDYSRDRKATTGSDIIRRSPSPVSLETAEWMERIRRDLLRLGREGYSPEYEMLIRQYFDALSRQKQGN